MRMRESPPLRRLVRKERLGASAPRRLGLTLTLYYAYARVSAAAPLSLRRCAALCRVRVSEQCSEMASRSILFSNRKNRVKGLCNFEKDFARRITSSIISAKLDESATLKEMQFS